MNKRPRKPLIEVFEGRAVHGAGTTLPGFVDAGMASGIAPQPHGHPPYGRKYAPPDPEATRSWDEELELLASDSGCADVH